jgi:hypothetical protein
VFRACAARSQRAGLRRDNPQSSFHYRCPEAAGGWILGLGNLAANPWGAPWTRVAGTSDGCNRYSSISREIPRSLRPNPGRSLKGCVTGLVFRAGNSLRYSQGNVKRRYLRSGSFAALRTTRLVGTTSDSGS